MEITELQKNLLADYFIEKLSEEQLRKILEEITPEQYKKITPTTLLNFVCEHYNVKIADVVSKSRLRELVYVRLIFVVLGVKIFDPGSYNTKIIKRLKCDVRHGIAGKLSKQINRHHTAVSYYLTKFRDYLDIGYISIDDFHGLENEMLQKFNQK